MLSEFEAAAQAEDRRLIERARQWVGEDVRPSSKATTRRMRVWSSTPRWGY